jgi:hypothetical protein
MAQMKNEELLERENDRKLEELAASVQVSSSICWTTTAEVHSNNVCALRFTDNTLPFLLKL